MKTLATAERAFWISLAALIISAAALILSFVVWQSSRPSAKASPMAQIPLSTPGMTAEEIEALKKDLERADANGAAASGNNHSSH